MEGKVVNRHIDSGVLTLRVLNADTHITDLLFYSERLRNELYERAVSELKVGVCISYEDTGYHQDYTLLATDVCKDCDTKVMSSSYTPKNEDSSSNTEIMDKSESKGSNKHSDKVNSGNKSSRRRRGRRNNKGGRNNG